MKQLQMHHLVVVLPNISLLKLAAAPEVVAGYLLLVVQVVLVQNLAAVVAAAAAVVEMAVGLVAHQVLLELHSLAVQLVVALVALEVLVQQGQEQQTVVRVALVETLSVSPINPPAAAEVLVMVPALVVQAIKDK
jgi:hypothetical protein